MKVYKGPDIFVPNAFTPNNDGRNDVLKAIPVGIKVFKYFVIYNRYGEKIFHSTNPSQGWNGNLNGRLQPNGVFVWYAEGEDVNGKLITRKGTVLLLQ
ncbi:MAG: gliding motility-associated C-terminal domain-containing protein [Flavisolibacter sp.]|nr:gliding motility-associated C-terminal domain-containing protein [Flavisolibacter sp.]